jgi:hypothetical protein
MVSNIGDRATLKDLKSPINRAIFNQKSLTPLQARIIKLYQITPVKSFTKDDLRFMILQKIGLEILIDKALEILDKDILIDVCYYEGDLLSAVLQIDEEYLVKNGYFEKGAMLINQNSGFLKTKLNSKHDLDGILLERINSLLK